MHRFVDADGHLDAFLARAADAEIHAVEGFLLDLVADPHEVDATAVPGTGLPLYTAIVPGTNVAVSWVVMKPSTYDVEYPVVLLRRIEEV